MRGAIKKDLGIECWLIIRNSKQVIKDNFLNFLCALSALFLVQNVAQLSFCMLILKWLFTLFQILSSRCMSSSQEFLGCTITKKVEEHCISQLAVSGMLHNPSPQILLFFLP